MNGAAVAVVGGGWAGLAAAVTLAAAGQRVTVFESTPTLGGRARRVNAGHTIVDNGQHILLGAYRQTIALLETVHGPGERGLLERRGLRLEEPGGFRFRMLPLPTPWNALMALIMMRGVSRVDRLATLAFARRLRRTDFRCASDLTVAALLVDQPAQVVRTLWEPLCVAVLNTPPESASAQIFLNAVRLAFSGPARNSDLLLPRVDLSALFPDAAARYVVGRGGVIRVGRSVAAIAECKGAVELAIGPASERYAACVIAVGPHQLEAVLASVNTPEVIDVIRKIAAFAYEPIRTVYLQYPVPLALSQPMLRLQDSPGQWLFDRGQLGGLPGLAAAVISTDVPEARTDRETLVRLIDAQVRRIRPQLPAPTWSLAIAERRATYACVPGLDRPLFGTLGSRLALAGDYTDPELPATLEAATRSGVAAARALLARLP
jgi:squalene-associated FAD-dependent desaturase